MHFPRKREVHRNDIILMYSTIVYTDSDFQPFSLCDLSYLSVIPLNRIGRINEFTDGWSILEILCQTFPIVTP